MRRGVASPRATRRPALTPPLAPPPVAPEVPPGLVSTWAKGIVRQERVRGRGREWYGVGTKNKIPRHAPERRSLKRCGSRFVRVSASRSREGDAGDVGWGVLMIECVATASRALLLRPADARAHGARVVASLKDIERGCTRRQAAAASAEKLIWADGATFD